MSTTMLDVTLHIDITMRFIVKQKNSLKGANLRET